MEVHQLRYLVTVAEEGGFSRAAERLRVAQPSLSQGIAKLEADLGQPLFDRLTRGVTPTAAGRKLLPYARRILADLTDAQRCVGERSDAAVGTVAVGVIPTVAPYLVRPLLKAAAESHPGLRLQVTEAVTGRLERALEDGQLDFAIVSNCRRGIGLHWDWWADEPLVAIVPEGHRLARAKTVRWAQLRNERFVTLHETHCLAQQIDRWCARNGLQPREDLAATQLATLLALVAEGQGVSLAPSMAVAAEAGRGCVFLPFGDGGPTREINVLRHPARFRSGATTVMTEVARGVVAGCVQRPAAAGGKARKLPAPIPG